MKILEYTLRFDTPAFLGNAEQNAQWRTPPLKALLRQWWRVAYAADKGFAVNLADMRREEGLLFGNAWLKENFCKSRVRMRLERWDEGKLNAWPHPDLTVNHPEVQQNHGNVGSSLYLGFGPLRFQAGTRLKANAAIQADESAIASLSLAMPEADAPLIERALWLMDRYGALGGRSRNGWGSCSLLPLPAGEGWGEGEPPLRPWQDCLQFDWPHAIGRDDRGPLIWQTQPPCNDWSALMQKLAAIKIGLRTQFVFQLDPAAGDQAQNNRINHGRPQNRHWLSYPVTNHDVRPWRNSNARLPNTLRFKVRPNGNGELVGVIFHVPHLPPAQFHPNLAAIQQVWSRVHAFLDQDAQQLTRIPE